MVITGRVGLVALICVLPIAVSPCPATAFVILLGLLLLSVIVDVALAASPRRLHLHRFGDVTARLGEPVDAVLVVENLDRRRFRGACATRGSPRRAPSPAVTGSTSLRDNGFGSSPRCGPCAAASNARRW